MSEQNDVAAVRGFLEQAGAPQYLIDKFNVIASSAATYEEIRNTTFFSKLHVTELSDQVLDRVIAKVPYSPEDSDEYYQRRVARAGINADRSGRRIVDATGQVSGGESDDDIREQLMRHWDTYRGLIAGGFTGSLPRDWFESVIDGFIEDLSATKGLRSDALEESAQLLDSLHEKISDPCLIGAERADAAHNVLNNAAKLIRLLKDSQQADGASREQTTTTP